MIQMFAIAIPCYTDVLTGQTFVEHLRASSAECAWLVSVDLMFTLQRHTRTTVIRPADAEPGKLLYYNFDLEKVIKAKRWAGVWGACRFGCSCRNSQCVCTYRGCWTYHQRFPF